MTSRMAVEAQQYMGHSQRLVWRLHCQSQIKTLAQMAGKSGCSDVRFSADDNPHINTEEAGTGDCRCMSWMRSR